MWRFMGQLACLLSLFSLDGCKFGQQGLPPDPLFANRKPIESKAQTGTPTAVAFSEPTPPANPYFADPRPVTGPILRIKATETAPLP
jgi:hypothetical protein